MERIYKSRELYVGYHPTLPPFSYYNDKGELVGYDIAFAYKLAHDMQVNLIFVPFYYHDLGYDLHNNFFDIAMSPVLLAEATTQNMNFPRYYLKIPNVMIVPRTRRKEFQNFDKLKKNPYLVIGVIGFYKEILNRVLPMAQSIQIEHVDNISTYLTTGEIDGLFWTKDQGMEYCRTNPDYVVIEYGAEAGDSFPAYPVKYNAFAFIFFLDRWMTIQDHIGFKKEQYQYWMQGQPPEKREPRWSLIRNVFHLIN